MLRCLDPNATFAYEPPGQDDVPAEQRLRIHCRYLSLGASMRLRQRRIDMHAAGLNDLQRCQMLVEVLAAQVVRIENLPAGTADGVNGLVDVAGWVELSTWLSDISLANEVSESERGKSRSQPPGDAERSAAAAAPASA